MQRTSLFISLLALSIFAPASNVLGQETGLHKMHAIKRMGGKLCMVEHEHAGQSLPSSTKAVALKLAINKWVEFTAWEYGKSWGSWRNSWAKKERCSGSSGNIVCEVTARPCRVR